MNIPVLIPAYNPDETLLKTVESLIEAGFSHIIIVNDGSSGASLPVFKKLESMEQCHVLRHAVNLGKGRALKTGFNFYYLYFEDSKGVITVDADGQHLPQDVLKVKETFLENPRNMVIGSRKFGPKTPLRSLIGNVATKHIFRLLVGKKISDTQSGLRCIPRNAIRDFIRMEGEKYEYEMNMLISTKTNAIDVVEEEISTVYIENNKSSHFNPLIDSMKIYFLLIRFAFSSVLASIIDFIIFAAVYGLSRNILVGIIAARLVAGNINFIINKKLVFCSHSNVAQAMLKYYTLFVVLGGLAYLLIQTMSDFGMNVMLAKAVTESLLFVASFSIQRDFIFLKQKES